MSQSSISVLMPVRNGAYFLNNMLSTLIQSVSAGDEIIAVEDGSSDNSFEILKKWRGRFSNLNIVRTGGVGLVPSLNLGISIATNPWIARYDVDDIYSIERLNVQRPLLMSENQVGVFSDYQVSFRDSINIGIIPSPIFDSAIKVSFVRNSRTPHPSSIFNKFAAIEVGAYRESDKFVEDMSLWLRLSNLGTFTSVPFNLLNYRIWKSSITSQNSASMKSARANLLKEIDVPLNALQHVVQNFENISSNYAEYTFSNERTLWLAYESLLLTSMKAQYRKIDKGLRKYIKSHLLTPNYINSASSIILKIVARKIARII